MLKKQFLDELTKALEGLPEDELNDRISFYSDMIDDRIEDGMSEEDAVGDIGTVEEVKSEIMSNVSLVKIVKHKVKPKRRLKTWEIVVLCVTSPIWVGLVIAGFAVILALVVALWAIVVALCAADIGIGVGGPIVSLTSMGAQFADGNFANGAAMLGVCILLVGIAFFLAIGCVALTKGVVKLIKFIVLKIKYGLVGGKKHE